MLVDRQKDVLNFLLKNRGEFINSKEIANSIGVSDKTIQKDIKQLNDYFMEKEVQIISRRGKGYKIFVGGEEAISKINDILEIIHKPDYFEESVSKLIIYLILQKNYVTKQSLQNLFYVSEKMIDTMIKEAERELRRSRVFIEIIPSLGIRLKGHELPMRYAFVYQMMKLENIPKEKWFWASCQYEVSKVKSWKPKVEQKLLEHGFSLGYRDQLFFDYYLIISLYRRNNLSTLGEFDANFNYYPVIIDFSRDISFFIFRSNYHETLYLSITMSFLVSESELRTPYLSSTVSKKIKYTIDEYFRKRPKFHHSLFNDLNGLIDAIYKAVLLSYFKNRVGYLEHNKDAEYIDYDIEYFVAEELAALLGFQLENIPNLKLYEDDIHRIAKLMNIHMKPIFQSKISTILIVFAESQTNAQFLKRKLENIGYIDVDVLRCSKGIDAKGYDLIISDCFIDMDNSSNVFLVNSLLQHNYICSSVSSMLDHRKNLEESFIELFEKENFHHICNVGSITKLLKKVLDKYKSDDVRSERILSNLNKRHLHYGGLITGNVMLPIIYLDTINKPYIEVFSFKDKTVWHGERVELLVIYLLPNDYENIHTLVPMHDLMRNRGIINSLCEVKSYEEFVKIIQDFFNKTENTA